jgi:hypothetical protein
VRYIHHACACEHGVVDGVGADVSVSALEGDGDDDKVVDVI